MLLAQQERCAICRRHFDNTGPRDLRDHVDHCHITGAVRGMLCGRCNKGLGQFIDSPAMLDRAIRYLSAAQKKTHKETT